METEQTLPHVTMHEDGPYLVVVARAFADGREYPLPAVLIERTGSGYNKVGRIMRQELWKAQDKADELSGVAA